MKFSQIKLEIKRKIIKKINKILYKNKKIKNKVLVIIEDGRYCGMGDVVIKVPLIEKIIEQEGKENVYFIATKRTTPLLRSLNYFNILEMNRAVRKNFMKALKYTLAINKIGFKKVINLEPHLVFEGMILDAVIAVEKIGYRKFEDKDYTSNERFYSKVIIGSEKLKNTDYMLKHFQYMYHELFKEKVNLDDLIPDLTNFIKVDSVEKIISIAIGAGISARNYDGDQLTELIKVILENKKNWKILLLGQGEEEIKKSKIIEKEVSNNLLENFVGKLTLRETMYKIAKSTIFIGTDSGLYNIAFGLKKKIICIYGEGDKNRFRHRGENIKILFDPCEYGPCGWSCKFREENVPCIYGVKPAEIYSELKK